VEIVWLPAGGRTRDAQIDYIARENPDAAARIDEDIERQVDLLADHPLIGRPGRRAGTRERVISHTPFIVIYRVRAERIEIIRVLHGAQQWPTGGR
jgi:toxin ParE1/3/4